MSREPSAPQQDAAMPNCPGGTNAAAHGTHAAFAWTWLLVATPFLTDIDCDILAGLILFFSWCVLAAVWLGLGYAVRPISRWWLSAGLAGCLGAALAFTDAGLAARVALCRPWLDAYADGVVAGTNDFLEEPHRVGLFLVDGTEERDGAVLLYSGGFINRNGIAYVPEGQGPPAHVHHVRHLTGPWYSFEWMF
jgi:hypothetical protein